MASTRSGGSANNDDWVNLTLPADSDQPHPNLQATANSEVTSVGANAEDRGHSNSWGLWSLVSWITTGSGDIDTSASSVDREDDSVDYVADASSNMAASAPQDTRPKGPALLVKKAGGAVKKIISKTRTGEPAGDRESWEFLDHEKEVSLFLLMKSVSIAPHSACAYHARPCKVILLFLVPARMYITIINNCCDAGNGAEIELIIVGVAVSAC